LVNEGAMADPPPVRNNRSYATIAAAIIIAAVVISAAIITSSALYTTVTKTTTATVTVAPSYSASSCVQLEIAPLFLLIANSSTGRRISGIPVQVEKTTPTDLCNPVSTTSTNIGTMETNVNGSIEVCCTGSTFFFTFTYMGAHYQFNSTAEGAQIAECLWFYVPSATSTTVFAAPFDPQC
jgi:hypothetical protein